MIKTSIKGFELRNVKHFLGHEQEDCYQGYIYYKGKKVGYYSDDSWGGSAIIDFDNIEYDKLFRDKAKEYLEERYAKDKMLHDFYDMFFTDLLQLISAHNDFIKAKRDGYQLMAILSIDGAWVSEQCISFANEESLKYYASKEKLTIEKVFREDKDFILD